MDKFVWRRDIIKLKRKCDMKVKYINGLYHWRESNGDYHCR